MTTQSNGVATAGVNQHKFEVVRTKEYHLFSHLDGNRSINKAHVTKLKDSMSEKYLVSPIIVNSKYEIIDGQHRFEACKDLNLPVLYIMVKGYGLEEVQRFNANQKNFSYDDFANGYIDLGLTDYAVLKDFRNKYGFDWGVCIAMLTGQQSRSGQDSERFKEGNFKVKQLPQATALADKIAEIGEHYKGYHRKYFLLAAMKMIKTPGYNHKHFMDKMRYMSARMVDCISQDDYLRLLETIYNFKSRTEILRFS